MIMLQTTFGEMLGSFNSSQINACVVGIGVLGPRFIVSSEGLGLHKMLPPRGFEPSTSRMPGKHRTPRPRLIFFLYCSVCLTLCPALTHIHLAFLSLFLLLCLFFVKKCLPVCLSVYQSVSIFLFLPPSPHLSLSFKRHFCFAVIIISFTIG